jgi:hypothetical protein
VGIICAADKACGVVTVPLPGQGRAILTLSKSGNKQIYTKIYFSLFLFGKLPVG